MYFVHTIKVHILTAAQAHLNNLQYVIIEKNLPLRIIISHDIEVIVGIQN